MAARIASRRRLIRGDLCDEHPPRWVHETVRRLANQPSAAIPLPVKQVTPAHVRALRERGLVATWSITRMQRRAKQGPLEEVVTEYAALTEAGQLLARRVPDPSGGLREPEQCQDPYRTIIRDTQWADALLPKPRKKRKAASPGSTTGAPGESSAA